MKPVMLYYGRNHHAHQRMAEAINAEQIQVDGGSPINRIKDAWELDLGNRPVITEGAIPLFQAVWMKKFGNLGRLVHLAADEAIPNIFSKYDHYSHLNRAVHLVEHQYVDAVLGISDKICELARLLGVEEVRKVRPFTDKYRLLKEASRDEGDYLMSLGSPVPKNGMGRLEEIAEITGREIIVVSNDTKGAFDSNLVKGVGWVDDKEFVDILSSSHGFILPANSQMFSVAVIEAMHMGVPPIVTEDVGASEILVDIEPQLVRKTNVNDLVKGVEWLMSADWKLSMELREKSEMYKPKRALMNFRKTWRMIENGN